MTSKNQLHRNPALKNWALSRQKLFKNGLIEKFENLLPKPLVKESRYYKQEFFAVYQAYPHPYEPEQDYTPRCYIGHF
ncbi:MAG: hypothetical protein K2X27_03205 [Candidatus Obscuribacterales bacterium]|nr:hypothetical protein [Candidatus Obscuribacterales bacterium]